MRDYPSTVGPEALRLQAAFKRTVSNPGGKGGHKLLGLGSCYSCCVVALRLIQIN